MPVQEEIFGRLPVAKKFLLIIGIFVAIVICVFFLGVLRSEILTGIRAYVGGEGLWSKAEKEAVLSLTKYAASRSESDYQEYLAEIAVPKGDKQARLQLQSPVPDMALVYQGFIQGRNHPQDVENMARLFRRFGHVSDMAQAIAIWTKGDAYIDQLGELAGQLHQEVNSPHPDSQKIQRLAEQIATVDAQVTPLEDGFSSTLGHGARRIDRILSIATLAASAVLLFLGIALSMAVLKRIRNSEEKYHNLINTANDAILVIDAETRLVLEANSKASELLGISESELIGKLESQLYPSEKSRLYRGLMMNPQADGTHDYELELMRSDGARIPVEVSASAAEWKGKRVVLGIFRDIRERLEAAAVLRRSEERFGYLIHNLSDVITVLAVDGTMIYHSPSLQRVTGYTPVDLLGQSLFAFVHPDDLALVRTALTQLILKPRSAVAPEFRFRHKDGSWLWLESVGNNLLHDSAVSGIVVTSRDVSGRRVLEEQVRQSQKMEALGRLAGGIAHDFNNLLMVIRGYAEIVLGHAVDSLDVRQNAETIIRATESAAGLTRQLLSFSRKHVFTPQVLDLNSLVNNVSEMLRSLIGEEIKVTVKVDPSIGRIKADPGQVEQVVLNLVVNARDAMPHGGKLMLETANVDVGEAQARRQSILPGSYVTLAVSDTGIGMDAETRSRIFEPFFTTKSKDEGTGLGLSVVYNVVRASAGHVNVESEPGHGSTFRVYFPRVEAEPLPAAEPSLPGISRAGTETILVAEDQPDLRWMICEFLQELGYSVLEAKDGTDALALAEHYQGSIDVLLTDVVMPGMRGPELVRRLSGRRPDMKVILMSGYTEGVLDYREAEEACHTTALLQKPFELKSLAAKIREVLGSSSRKDSFRS